MLKYKEILQKVSFVNSTFPQQPQEIEIGNREYKLNLDFFKYKQKQIKSILDKKATQMSYRINEGAGKAIYFIGVADNGDVDGINIKTLINSLYFFCDIVRLSLSKFYNIRIYKGNTGYVATIRTYKPCHKKHLLLELD